MVLKFAAGVCTVCAPSCIPVHRLQPSQYQYPRGMTHTPAPARPPPSAPPPGCRGRAPRHSTAQAAAHPARPSYPGTTMVVAQERGAWGKLETGTSTLEKHCVALAVAYAYLGHPSLPCCGHGCQASCVRSIPCTTCHPQLLSWHHRLPATGMHQVHNHTHSSQGPNISTHLSSMVMCSGARVDR